jgi:3-hydroxy acid dehydrogenase / malonic semialdehyde reductase
MSSMAQRLKGKTIVITGASSGIGKACAIEFAKTCPEDLKLVLTARRIDTLKEVAKEVESAGKGVKCLPVKLDVSKPEEVNSFVGNLPKEFSEVDVLVNNACVYPYLQATGGKNKGERERRGEEREKRDSADE